MDKLCCVDFERVHLKFNTKYDSHTRNIRFLYTVGNLRALPFQSAYAFFYKGGGEHTLHNFTYARKTCKIYLTTENLRFFSIQGGSVKLNGSPDETLPITLIGSVKEPHVDHRG